jgi:hypothetical protein
MILGMSGSEKTRTPSLEDRRNAQVANVIEGRTTLGDFTEKLKKEIRDAGYSPDVIRQAQAAVSTEEVKLQRRERTAIDSVESEIGDSDDARLQRNRRERIQSLSEALVVLDSQMEAEKLAGGVQ